MPIYVLYHFFPFLSSRRIFMSLILYISADHFVHQEPHWLDVPERVQYEIGVVMHSCLHGQARRCLTDHCITVSDVSAWQHLRSANQRLLVVPQCLLSTLGRRAFSLADTSLCNSSRQLVRSGSSQGQFQTSAEVAFCYTLL